MSILLSNNVQGFHDLVATGQLYHVQNLISTNGYDPNLPHTTTGLRPIHFAASRGHLKLVEYLVETTFCQVDSIDKEGETALLKAAYTNHLPVVKYLVHAAHANYLQQDGDGWTALHNACSCGSLEIVKFLTNLQNINVNITSKQGHTPLMNAASKGHVDIVVYLLEEVSANPLIKNKFGETAYDVAAAAGEAYVCQVIEQCETQQWDLSVEDRLSFHVTAPVFLMEEQQMNSDIESSSVLLSLLLPLPLTLALPLPLLTTRRPISATSYSPSQWVYKEKVIKNKSREVPLPNTCWFWLSDWTVDYTWPCVNQQDGWSRQQPVVASDSSIVWIRKRRWVRIMKKAMVVSHQDMLDRDDNNSSSSSVSNDEDLTSFVIPFNDASTTTTATTTTFACSTKTGITTGTTMTKAKSTFINCSALPQPLLQEQIQFDSHIEEEHENTSLYCWEDNEDVVDCRRCQSQFNFFIRKHHCRQCGQVVCGKCSSHREMLPSSHIIQPPSVPDKDVQMLSLQPQRVCDQCSFYNHDKKKRGGEQSGGNSEEDNIMEECPVCYKDLLNEYESSSEREDHVQMCLNKGQSSSLLSFASRYIEYKLARESRLIGQECIICFEEFQTDDTVIRLNCMCSYHGHCINTWFSKGKECPIHSQ